MKRLVLKSGCLAMVGASLLHADQPAPRPGNGGVLEVGEYKLLYPSWYINDHCVLYDADRGKWHMFGIHGGHKSFIHLTSKSLTANSWTEASSSGCSDRGNGAFGVTAEERSDSVSS